MHKPKTVDPITLLPFVKDRPNWKLGDKRHPRDFWAVESTGDYGADCETGGELARVALDYVIAENFPVLLGWIVLDMVDKGKESNNGLIVGFMAEIARHAAYGRKVLKAVEEAQPDATVAIMKAVNNPIMLATEAVYPEAGHGAA